MKVRHGKVWETIESANTSNSICPACGDMASSVGLPKVGTTSCATCLECGTTFVLSRERLPGRGGKTRVTWIETLSD